MTTTIGPYTFSDTDVLQTLLHTVDLLDGYPQDVRPFQTARRERINTAISGRNPSSMSPDERAALLGRVWPELFDARADLVAGDLLPEAMACQQATCCMHKQGGESHQQQNADRAQYKNGIGRQAPCGGQPSLYFGQPASIGIEIAHADRRSPAPSERPLW